MADSIREQILQAAAALIASEVTPVPVYRSRVDAFSRRQASAVVIEPGFDRLTQELSQCKLDWEFSLSIAIYTRGQVPDQLADPIVQKVHEALMVERTLGGLALHVTPVSIDPQLEAGDEPSGWIQMVYAVRYRTQLTALDAQ